MRVRAGWSSYVSWWPGSPRQEALAVHLAASSWIYTLSQRGRDTRMDERGTDRKKSQTVCSGFELKLADDWRRKFHRKRRILWVPKMAGLPDVEFHRNVEVSLQTWMELCFSDKAKHLTKRRKVWSTLQHIVVKNCLLRQEKFRAILISE